jgi:hypothetical protein
MELQNFEFWEYRVLFSNICSEGLCILFQLCISSDEHVGAKFL